MRAFEGFIFIFNIMAVGLFIIKGYKKIKWAKYVPLFTIVFLIIHLIVEKPRWQLYPLYLVTVLCLFMVIFARRLNLQQQKVSIGILTFLIFVSVILAYIFPVYKMPIPNGEYKIGTQSFDLIDPERKAVYSSNINDKRKIKIQIWYPAETIQGYERVPWMREGKLLTQTLAREMKLPSFALDQTTLVMSNSYEKAPISEKQEKYPVIVISHGWTGFTNLHTDVAEELASNGYIVVGIDHTFGSQITVFNDGEVSYLNKEALPDGDTVPNFMEYANKLVTTYSGDISLTLDELEQYNDNEIIPGFKGKIDLSKIGLLGHSTGGGADVSLALEDTRIKAVLGMDAWVEPIDEKSIEKGLEIPALFLRSGQWEVGANNKNLLRLMDKSTAPISLYQINDTNHSDFTMVYRYSPLTKYMKLTGKLHGETASSIQKDFIQEFFDLNLKNSSDTNIDDLVKKWKEVEKIR